MSKGRIVALCMVAILMIILLFNRDSGSVDLIIGDPVKAMKALIYLSFTALGTVIGILLK